jgi:hypothetical protein
VNNENFRRGFCTASRQAGPAEQQPSTSASIPRQAKASRAPHATGHGCGWAGVVCNCCQNSTPRLKFDAQKALPTNNSVSRGSGTHNWAAGHERATDCAIDWSGPWWSAHLRHDIGRPGFSLLAHHGPRHLRHYASADVTSGAADSIFRYSRIFCSAGALRWAGC